MRYGQCLHLFDFTGRSIAYPDTLNLMFPRPCVMRDQVPHSGARCRHRSARAKKQLFCALLPDLSSSELTIVSFGKSFGPWVRKQSRSKSRLSSRRKDNDSDKARRSFTAGLLAITLGTPDQT